MILSRTFFQNLRLKNVGRGLYWNILKIASGINSDRYLPQISEMTEDKTSFLNRIFATKKTIQHRGIRNRHARVIKFNLGKNLRNNNINSNYYFYCSPSSPTLSTLSSSLINHLQKSVKYIVHTGLLFSLLLLLPFKNLLLFPTFLF